MGKTYKKAQSAMEYLMTYGWAILIIAIVLAALFSLGVFSSSSFLGTTCVASSGYLCQSPLLHTGTLTLTFGQSTGTNWGQSYIAFIQSGAGAPSTSLPACGEVSLGTSFASGQQAQVTIANTVTNAATPTCTTFSSTVGTSYSGALWVSYVVNSQTLISQVATLTLKAS